MEPDSDERRWSTLMGSAQQGNESDYRQLLTEISDVIYNYLHSRFGYHDFIEDCAQESLIAIHQARHTYDSSRAFRPWMFAIVRHKAIDMLRQQSNRQRVADDHQREMEVLGQSRHLAEPENNIGQSGLFGSLPAQYGEVLALTKIMGYSIEETAKKLGISKSAVKVRVHRAIRKLQKSMEAEES